METPNPAEIHDPWSLVAFIIVCGLIGFIAWRASRHAKRAADEIVHQARPNSGQSLKDALNRIEDRQIEQGERIAALEAVVERRGSLEKRN
jgi:hypothetical protein